MKFDPKTIKTLEFDKIREHLADCAETEGAKRVALALVPSGNFSVVTESQTHTTDALRLLDAKGRPSFGGAGDLTPLLDKAEKGAILVPSELLEAADLMRVTELLTEYIKTNVLFETSLDGIFESLIPTKELEKKIRKAILAADLIADDASPALADIRRKKRRTNNRIKELLTGYTQGACSKFLQENIVTQRNGRYVVPVKAEYRSSVKGLIHDTSASGATLFIEPMAVVEANNDLKRLEAEETHETERILGELSLDVANKSEELGLNYSNIVRLSYFFACAEFSKRIKGVRPKISEDGYIDLVKARHPLIDADKVVPIDIGVGKGHDTLIITGPNTGGKTVSLKTLGLLCMMAQSGLHIPADESSSVRVSDDILADIGDEQSIEQSLSTFSAHMVNIVGIIKKTNDKTLVLFDELGVGTDPVEGAALAVAVIEAVRAKGAFCAATTHYAELKVYALETEGVENGSCEFDVDTLRPTYKLNLGIPGRSNAFAISARLGLPSEIIERARHMVNADELRFEDVIGKLEKSRVETEENRHETALMRKEYEDFKSRAEREINEKLKAADEELGKARAKANAIIESARASSNYILTELNKVKKAKDDENFGSELERTKDKIKAYMREHEEKYDPAESAKDDGYRLPRPLVKGDAVFLTNLGLEGTALSPADRQGNVLVQVGNGRITTDVRNLRLLTKKKRENIPVISEKRGGEFTAEAFGGEIDLRGLTGEEAWIDVDRYIDEAVMHGLGTVTLIHGKGTGALRKALWNFLGADARVKSYRLGKYGEGDAGVTVVSLK